MKLQQLVKNIEKKQLKTELSPIQIGSTVKVNFFIQKGNKKRIQPYEGTIIAQHRAGLSTTITVRRICQNVGIEQVISIHSPLIKDIELIRQSKVRRAKLYYLRTRIGKSTRLKQRFN